MHSILLNSARITFGLIPKTPFLIKDGNKGGHMLHPERPDMAALRTRRRAGSKDGGDTVFIPGSSLKGVMRSSAERVLRSLVPETPFKGACDPLEDRNSRCQTQASRCGDDLRKDRRNAKEADPFVMGEVHKMLCMACRTFGSQALASRVRFADVLPTEATLEAANRTEERQGVAIDRKTGGPSRGKLYGSEIVVDGHFEATIHVENFQLWQLALLGIVLEDMSEGLTRIGSAKSRGLGVFGIGALQVDVRQQRSAKLPAGIGKLAPKLVESYGLIGLADDDVLKALPQGASRKDDPVWERWSWSGEDAWGFFRQTQEHPWQALVSAVEDRKP